jgi:hypothetical protein
MSSMRSSFTLFLLALATACASRQAARPSATSPNVRISFVAQEDSFTRAALVYEQLWATEGPRIVEAMERISGLDFVTSAWADTAITARVLERPSESGFRSSPMVLRASYPIDTKRATLVHELGHRLQSGLFRREEEEHPHLFLWIYDVWVELYGREFADAQVAVERRRGGPYPAAWDQAMALTAIERAARWRSIRDERMSAR